MNDPQRVPPCPPWMVGEVDLRYVIRVPPPVRDRQAPADKARTEPEPPPSKP